MPFTLRTDAPAGFTTEFMSNPFMKGIQKKLSPDRCAELPPATDKAMRDTMAPDGFCSRSMSALVVVATKTSESRDVCVS